METHVLVAHELLPQWTRAAFHDAGTFDKSANVGGANGCLLNHFPMRLEPENAFLRLPPNTLMDVTAHLIYSTSTFSVIMSLGIVRASDYYKQFTVNIVTLFSIRFFSLRSTQNNDRPHHNPKKERCLTRE
jgi:hypothetical protein